MANSKFEYVKKFELDDRLLPQCWIVVRIDGKAFHKFSDTHAFAKPNDDRALHLMNACARVLMEQQGDIVFAIGASDEYSFVLKKDTSLYGRRASKIISVFVSTFAANYVALWAAHFPTTPLQYCPAFDARAVCYPNDATLRDYLSWRQVDYHINNQYNTCFWCLVHAGSTPAEAQGTLKGTLADFKNELLFSRFSINYNTLPLMHRRGTILYKEKASTPN
eukprot:jgi/Mesvir1/29714/Mv00947-RA.1